MQIGFSPINFTPISKSNSNNNIKLNNLTLDSISFKGTIEPKSERIKKAEAFGMDVYALYQNGRLTPKNIEKLANRNTKENGIKISVRPIEDLKLKLGDEIDTSRYKGYLLPEYNNNCKLKNLTMYVPSTWDMKTIGNAAHEYTHALQYLESEDYLGIAEYTNHELLPARMLNSYCLHTFTGIEETMKMGEIFNEAIEISESQNKDIKSALIEAFGLSNEKECKRTMKRIFNSAYEELNEEVINSEKSKYLPFKNDPLMMRRAVRKTAKERAEREIEAYTAQRNLIQTIDKNALTNENKVNPAFYELIKDALS